MKEHMISLCCFLSDSLCCLGVLPAYPCSKRFITLEKLHQTTIQSSMVKLRSKIEGLILVSQQHDH